VACTSTWNTGPGHLLVHLSSRHKVVPGTQQSQQLCTDRTTCRSHFSACARCLHARILPTSWLPGPPDFATSRPPGGAGKGPFQKQRFSPQGTRFSKATCRRGPTPRGCLSVSGILPVLSGASCRPTLSLHTPQSATVDILDRLAPNWASQRLAYSNCSRPISLPVSLDVRDAPRVRFSRVDATPGPINRDARKACQMHVNQISGRCSQSGGAFICHRHLFPTGTR
jgi:hypothetical protein